MTLLRRAVGRRDRDRVRRLGASRPTAVQTYRWVLLLCAVVLALAAVSQRDVRAPPCRGAGRRRRAERSSRSVVVLLDDRRRPSRSSARRSAATADSDGGPAGWELVLAGLRLRADRLRLRRSRARARRSSACSSCRCSWSEAGMPGRDGASLIGWPIVLLAIAVALLVIGLRPRAELPPEPSVRRARMTDATHFQEALDRAHGGGPERHREKSAEQGKLPVRERVARLLDEGSLRRGGAAGQLGAGRPRRRRRRHRAGHARRPPRRGHGQRPDGQGRLVGPEDRREDPAHPGARARAAGADVLPRRLGRARGSPSRCRCSPAAAAPGGSSSTRCR